MEVLGGIRERGYRGGRVFTWRIWYHPIENARAHDFRVDDFIKATASGQASEKRRRLHELTSILEPATASSSASSRGSAGPSGRS